MKFKVSYTKLLFGIILFYLVVLYVGEIKNSFSQQAKPKASQTTTPTKSENIREIEITAKQFSFSPDVIPLKLNEKVRFYITTEDVTHGFSLPEFNIDEVIEPGKETVIDFHASRRGEFTFLCSVQCGSGHPGMKGTIIIE